MNGGMAMQGNLGINGAYLVLQRSTAGWLFACIVIVQWSGLQLAYAGMGCTYMPNW